MSENHERLQQLGVSHDVIDTLVDTAHQNNALGAKVTGGGLGGCMIALVETEEDALHLQEQFMKQGAQAVWIQSLAKKGETQMTSNIGITRAHTNIALIKYWGKENKELFIPMNSSLSLTLEAFYTDTKVELTDALTEDKFYLNGAKQDEAATAKITRFLDLFRAETGDTRRARVESLNFVPTAAGLASSASAFAALAGAMNEATGLRMPAQQLSTYARRGSGSATRSLFGGFVEWNKGDSNENSMAIPVDDANFDIGMIIIVVSAAEKKISSRAGMELTVSTSPFYEGWVTSAATDLADIKQAIKDRDIHRIGSIAEFNGMKMHATMLASNPSILLFSNRRVLSPNKRSHDSRRNEAFQPTSRWMLGQTSSDLQGE